MLPRHLQLTGLLHDASEAFLGDLSSPLKSLLPAYRELQTGMEGRIAGQFGLAYPYPAIVKTADLVAMATEKRDLMPVTGTDNWEILDGIVCLPYTIEPWQPKEAAARFLKLYNELTDDIPF
jgi:5'-deoxynucleotidase YfbR-like HD superfamily hydrolase